MRVNWLHSRRNLRRMLRWMLLLKAKLVLRLVSLVVIEAVEVDGRVGFIVDIICCCNAKGGFDCTCT